MAHDMGRTTASTRRSETKCGARHDRFRGEVTGPSSQSLDESCDEFCNSALEQMGAIESSLNMLSSSAQNNSTLIAQLRDYNLS